MLSWFPDAGPDSAASYMPGTSGCSFFYDRLCRKGGSVPRPCVFWVGRRVGGREGTEITLGLAGNVGVGGLCRFIHGGRVVRGYV